jgi:hypothetical protein
VQLAAERYAPALARPEPTELPTAPIEPEDGTTEWATIKREIEPHLPPVAFMNWFRSTRQRQCAAGVLTVQVQSAPAANYLQQEYGTTVEAAIERLSLPITVVRYECAASAAA